MVISLETKMCRAIRQSKLGRILETPLRIVQVAALDPNLVHALVLVVNPNLELTLVIVLDPNLVPFVVVNLKLIFFFCSSITWC